MHQLAEIRHVPALDFAIVAVGLAVPTMRSIALTPGGSAGILRLVVLSETFLAIPFLNPCIRFRVRRFFDREMPSSISPDQFPFCLQPIFQVITEQSAVSAVDLVRAIQNLFDLQRVADCISVKDHALQFNLFRDFAM
jgi:hypothetical protein